MDQVHELIVSWMDAARHRVSSRRAFLVGSGRIAGGGALAVALAGMPALRGLNSALAATDFKDDLAVVQYALTLEHLEYAFYRDGLRMFSAADFEESYPATLYPNLEAIRNHEGTHVEQLTKVVGDLGGTPVEEAEYDFGYEDIDGFLNVAAILENTGVSAYAGAAPAIKDKAILAAA